MANTDGKHMVLGIVLLCGVLAVPLWSWGQTAESIGKVLAVEGVAEVRAAPATEWERLRFKDLIFLNDTLRTAANSKVKVLLRDDSIMTLAEQSEMQFTDFLLTDQQRRSIVNLFVGKVRMLTTRLFGGGSFAEVHTPNAVAGVRGSDEHIAYDAATRQTTVLCASGGGSQDDHCYIRDRTDASKILNIPGGHIVELVGLVLPSTTRQATPIEQQNMVAGTQVTVNDPQEIRRVNEQPPAGTPRGETAGTTPTGPPASAAIATAAIPPAPEVLTAATVNPSTIGQLASQDNPQITTISDPSASPAAQAVIDQSRAGIIIVIPR